LAGYSGLFDAGGSAVYLTANVQDHISSPAHNTKYDATPDAPGPAPASTSIADWFRTSVDPLGYGWSYISYAEDAFVGYSQYRGYQFEASTRWFGTVAWNDLVGEINANRPLMFLVDTNGDGGSDHFVPVIGYDDRGLDGKYYGFYTTWSEDETIAWAHYQGMGTPWGVGYATFLAPAIPEPASWLLLLGSLPLLWRIGTRTRVNLNDRFRDYPLSALLGRTRPVTKR
jgi:hypothetical protein